MTNKKYFFIGIGGIGMSSIAQYLHDNGNVVFGYDKLIGQSVEILLKKGIEVIDKLSFDHVPDEMKLEDVIVIYTPAIKNDNVFLDYFLSNGKNKILKRSQILGEISKNFKCIAIAGTHGKTTTTAIMSHLLYSSGIKFKAFIGGILKGFGSNFINTGDDYIIVEADEYDRSFLNLKPEFGIITSIESDHLDVYGSFESLNDSFKIFSRNITNTLIANEEVDIIKDYSFSINSEADYVAKNIRNIDKGICFDLKTPIRNYSNLFVNIIGMHNLKNVLSVLALIDQINEINIEDVLPYLSDFKGVERRMEIYNFNNKVIIDDYAHHPTEIKSVYDTIKSRYKNKSTAVIFQPHLYSRTRDFMNEFAKVLSMFDKVYLLDIYPAREEPIKNVSSKILLEKIQSNNKEIIDGECINELIINSNTDVICILGAGDIIENLNKEILTND